MKTEPVDHAMEAGATTTAPVEMTAVAEQLGNTSTLRQKRPRKHKKLAKDKASASTRSNQAGVNNRVAKPPRAKQLGIAAKNRQQYLIAEAQNEAAAFKARGVTAINNGSNDHGNPLAFGAIAEVRDPLLPPQPARDVFCVLPEGANPIDRAVFSRLAEVWDEEAGRWTEDMQRSFLDNLPRARVTRTTAMFTNHYVARTVRLNDLVPTWGQFMMMRVMFGPAVCFRQEWAREFAMRYPLAKEDAWEGVVPEDWATIRDVLDGTMGMPTPRRRKISVMTLSKERGRVGKLLKRASMVGDGAGGGGCGLLTELVQIGRPETQASGGGGGKGDIEEVDEDTWRHAKEAARAAMSMDPKDVIARMEAKYRAQEEQDKALQARIDELRASNQGIRKWVSEYTQVLTMKPV